MANPEHVAILRQGVDRWNRWREEYWGVLPDLKELQFEEGNLTNGLFNEVNLYRAKLSGTHLKGADFRGANLRGADLRGANLSRANLHQTLLEGASLSGANLEEAVLTGTHLLETIFANTLLGGARGLKACRHSGPSTIDQRTLSLNPHLPIEFLRGCGLSNLEIKSARLLYGRLTSDEVTNLGYEIIRLRNASPQAFQFHSCFISYSSKDNAFAQRLHVDLQEAGVRCWFDQVDLRIGDKIRGVIDSAIRLHDKLLLILSEGSLESNWVEGEVEAAFEKERTTKETTLFPIRLDEAVMATEEAWAATLRRSRHIGDFSRWNDEAEYQRAFERLLRDLKAS